MKVRFTPPPPPAGYPTPLTHGHNIARLSFTTCHKKRVAATTQCRTLMTQVGSKVCGLGLENFPSFGA